MSLTWRMPAAISSYLSEYVVLRRRRRIWRAVGRGAAYTLAAALLCALIDRAAALPGALRIALLSLNVAVALVLVGRPLLAMVLAGSDWREASGDIEQRQTHFDERLQTVVSQHLAEPAYRGSPQILDLLGQQAAELLGSALPRQLLPRGPVVRPWVLAAAAAAATALLWMIPVLDMPRLLGRYFAPWIAIAPATTTRLAVSPGDADVLEGQSLDVTVRAQRLGARPVVLHYQKQGAPARLVMPPTSSGEYRATIGPVERDMQYAVSGGDARSRDYTIRVLRRPVVSEFRIRYSFPASTRRDSLTVSNTDGLIEAPVGTMADLSIVATEPLASAQLELSGKNTVVLAATDQPHIWAAQVPIQQDATYVLRMASTRGIAGAHENGVIRAIPDSPPLVTLGRPPSDLRLHPRDILALPYQAMDDYGIQQLAMRIQVQGTGGGGAASNLALGQPAEQSSTWGDCVASRAVDGNTDGNLPAGSVTHTNNEPQNWWQVDLGRIQPLSVIELFNRTDAAPERLTDFFVMVSNDPMERADLETLKARGDVSVYHVPDRAGSPSGVDVYRDARFVRVHLPRPEFLSLAEVRVYEARRSPDASAATQPAAVERGLPIFGDSRRQDADLRLDLATLNVAIGDVVLLSVAATDTAGQTSVSEACRIIVLPRSIDLNTHERIAELRAAEELSRTVTAELEAAARTFDQANPRQQPNQDAYLAALAEVTHRLAAGGEAAEQLVPSLLRATARSPSSDLSGALANYADQAQTSAVVARDVNEQFGLGAFPSEDAKQDLHRTIEEARRTQQELVVISHGQQAEAILADIDNLKATRSAGPYGDRESAELARQRSQRMRDEIAQAVREIGIDPHAGDLENQLQQRVAAADNLIRSRRAPQFEQPAREFAEDLKRDPQRELPLDERLHTAAQAEAIRPDADLAKARDLMLASAAVAQLQSDAQYRPQPPSGEPRAADQLDEAVAAVQREHELAQRPADKVPEEQRRSVGEQAAQARHQLAEWARLHAMGEQPPTDVSASRQAEHDAMQANADMAQRPTTRPAGERAPAQSATAPSEARTPSGNRPPGEADEATSRLEQLRADMEQASREAEALDELIAEQQELQNRTQEASSDEAGELGEQQEELAGRVATASDAHAQHDSPFSEIADDDPDSRIQAANAIALAQEQLAAMPQVLQLTRRAAELWTRLQDVQAEAERQAAQAAPSEQGLALRVAASAKAQALEAQGRLSGVSTPVQPQAAAAMAVALSPYAPETTQAVQRIGSRLAPALALLQRTVESRDLPGADRAIVDARKAIEQVQNDLSEAQDQLMDRNPLASARAFAESAARSLQRPVDPDMAAAQRSQATAVQALRRAEDQAVHRAASARLGQLPSMGSVLLPMVSGRGVSQGSGTTGQPAALPLLREWGRLQARRPEQLNIAPVESAPPGYQDALKAYFEALGQVSERGGQ